MLTINEIKDQKEQKVTELIKASSMFFAFSNEQFQENKTPLQEGEKYVHIGAGAYMPKSKVPVYLEGIKDIDKWYKKAVKDNKARKANIIYELGNYECWYTYDLQPAIDALGSDYTREEIQKVFNEERNNQVVEC
jgi:hypothetical protein